MNNYTAYYRELHKSISIPQGHIDYLKAIDYTPKVAYDIGAAVLHWTKEAKKIWPSTEIVCFEGLQEVEDFFQETDFQYVIELLGDKDGREVEYFYHPNYIGGNSYYRENVEFSPAAADIYKDSNKQVRKLKTVDTIVKERNLPLPDLVKIDTQGSEIDILNGMTETLKSVKHLIVELQHVQYNIGAKLASESIPFIESLGFKLVDNNLPHDYFHGNGPDADYHFIKNV